MVLMFCIARKTHIRRIMLLLRTLLSIVLLAGLVTGPAMMGRMAVDHARAEITAQLYLSYGEICGTDRSDVGGHAHCDYCQIAAQGALPVESALSRQTHVSVCAPHGRVTHPARSGGRWLRPPMNAPPVFV
ncbi:MAG: hypothetical protein WBC68_06180 [Albidovulum sp.]